MARPSRYKSATQRKLTAKIKKTVQKYNVQSVQSLRGQTLRKGGDPQKDWMRWRQPKNAILDMLSPEAKKRLTNAGVNINLNLPSSAQPQYNPLSKTLDISNRLTADGIRHELTHAGLALAPDMFPGVGTKSKFANSALGTMLGAMNTRLMPKAGQQFWAEQPAITMGGADAYPGYKQVYEPDQFSQFFNTNTDSWQYKPNSGWDIGK